MEMVRVIRILVYQGKRDWVEKTLAQGAVPANGRYVIPQKFDYQKPNVISSSTITEFPEILSDDEFEQELEDEKRS